jgi:hypothetical protein
VAQGGDGVNDKKYLQVIEWACQFREEAEATGRGTCFPTVQECAKRFRIAQKAILEAIDSGDHPRGYHVAYNVAIASGGGTGDWRQSEYEIEVWRNNPADLRFDQATADEFRAFWEAQGWTVLDAEAEEISARRVTESHDSAHITLCFDAGVDAFGWIGIGECDDHAKTCCNSRPSTFGEALEILNELANTRAFGGWAVEEGRAEGS